MNFGGPQSTRDRTWLRKPAELSGEREELVMERNAEKQVYEGELTRLRKENAVLRDQLQRCHIELRTYQVKYPNEAIHVESEGNEDLPPWVTSAEHMTPLLQVYDERIAELQKELAHQKEVVESFQEKTEEILAENEALREAQFQYLQQNPDGSGGANPGLNPLGPHNVELLNELNERLHLLVNENALLIEEKAELSGELDEALTELELRTDAVAKLSNQLGILSQEIQTNRQQLAQAERDREDSANRMLKCSDTLNQREIELSDAKEQLSVWEERCLHAEKNVEQFEQQVKQLTHQLEEDSLVAMRRLKVAEERVKELHLLLLQKTQDLENAQEVARKLRREYQSTRQDAEGMLQVMSGLERQLAEYSGRESEIEKLGRESKEKLEEAYIARDQAATREVQLKRDVDRLLEDRKKAILQKQGEIDAAVEMAKSIAANQIASLEHDLEDMTGRITRSKAEADRVNRELKASQLMVEKMRLAMDDERKLSDQAMRKIEERLRELTTAKEEASLKVKAVQDMNTELRSTIDKLRTQDESSRTMIEERDRQKDKEIEKLRASLREIQRDTAENNAISNRRQREFQEYKQSMEQELSELQKRKDDDIESYRKRCVDAEHTAKEMELLTNAETHRVKLLVEQFKEKANIANLHMETKMVENKEKMKQLTDKLRETEERNRLIEIEKSEASHQLQDLKGKYHRIQDQNKEYEREIEDLSLQLTLSLEARENLTRTTKPKRIMKSIRESSRDEINLEGIDPNGSEDEAEIDQIMNEISSGD